MKLNELKQTKNISVSKRVGRGESSGKGKTSGKGYKGQKSRGRGKVRLGFEGGQLPLIKRLPFRRGVGNNLAKKTLTITVERLNIFENGDTVDAKGLIEKGLLKKTYKPDQIKIVGSGKLEKSLTITVSVSAVARETIEKAKGKIVESKTEETKDKKDA